MRSLSPRRRRRSRLAEQFDAVVRREPVGDRYELFSQLRREAPIFFSNALRAWVVSRYVEVRTVLENRQLRRPSQGPGMSVLAGGFVEWYGREYTRKMGMVARRIRSPRALNEEVGTKVGAIARELAFRLPLGEVVDLRDQYAKWMPLLLICELTNFDRPAELRSWYETLMARATGSRTYEDVRDVGLEAMRELESLLGPVLKERRRHPGADLISDLVSATYDDQSLPDEEVLVIVAQLYAATMETTERVLTSSFRHLARNPELLVSLRERLPANDDILASFGAEALRMYSPIQAITRSAVAPAQISGHVFSKGEAVTALLASANRDEHRFEDAPRFDENRFLENPDRQYTTAGDILPFGAGEHHCVGARLAKLLIVEALRHLFERVDRIELRAEVEDAGDLIFWSPSSLEVVLHPLSSRDA